MKKIYLSVVCGLLFISHLSLAQRNCAVMDHHQKLVEQDPQIQFNLDQINQFTEQFIANGGGVTNKVAVTIPVVVHVLYNTSTQNISDAQIQSQLTVLNADFKKQNTDWSNTPSVYSSLVANCELTFCLANRDASGNAHTGIIRKSTTKTVFDAELDDAKYNSTGGSDAWSSSSYLNIWVVPSIKSGSNTGILGYAQFPGGPAATDGLVICHNYFGTTGSVSAPFNKGRTATHEIGHWLNCYHIWGDDDGACTGSDQCSDTPNQADENYGTPTFPQTSCSNSGDMHMNYMDYVDDAAMYMFTTGQKARMQALFTTGGARASLINSLGCSGGTSTPAYCTANGTNVQYEWINNVTVGTINNTTSSNAGYGNFTNLSTNLTIGTSNSISLKPGFASSTYTEYFNVYIDYNKDLDFADAGELVYSGSGTSTISGTFTIPSTTTTGTSRMRVIMKDGAISSSCGSYTYGEVEDYTVNFVSATVTCNAPSSLTSSSITSSSASLTWAAVTGASNYTVQVKQSTSSTWTSYTASSNSLSLTGLTASKIYNWQVKTNCVSGSSAFVAGTNFTTLASTTGCTDNYETNNTKSAAKSIAVNTNISAKIGTSTDQDWFYFSNTSTYKNIKVTLSNLPADYDLYLYNSAGTLLYSSENGSTSSETIKYNNAPVATYYVLVKGYNSAYSSSLCYTLNASRSSTAYKEMENEEENLVVKKTEEHILTMLPNPTQDGKFTVRLYNEQKGEINLEILDFSGRIIEKQSFMKNEDWIQNAIDLQEKNAGVYFVRMYNDSFNITEKLLYVK
ncbi:MAG: T9SS type A sorting domain-containing protein [Flavobacteriia bacterium]|nr:T9SS type A sorting domain-containing protein [Flavobacteriia bacterium]